MAFAAVRSRCAPELYGRALINNPDGQPGAAATFGDGDGRRVGAIKRGLAG